MLPPQFPFVGYSPDPDGGTTFHKPDGSSLYAYGPEADRIKGMLDRYPAEPDQRLAENDLLNPDGSLREPGQAPTTARAAPPPEVTDAALPPQTGTHRWMGGRDLGMSDAPPTQDQRTAMADPVPYQVGVQPDINAPIPGTEAPYERPRHGKTVVEHVQPRPGAAPDRVPDNGAVPPPPADTSKLPMMGGAPDAAAGPLRPTMELPPVDPLVHSAAVDPKKLAANAFAVPTTQSFSSEGGIQDPDQRKELESIYAQRADAEKRLSAMKESAANVAYQRSQAEEIASAQAVQKSKEDYLAAQARDATVNTEHAKRVSFADQEMDRQAKREVDQFRVFRGKPGAQIGALLGAIMGGIGQALERSQTNRALDAIERTIQNDINAQSDEIQAGRAKAGNDLARIRDQYGLDHEDSKTVLKLSYEKQKDALARQQAAQIGTPQAAIQYAAIQADSLKRQADLSQELWNSENGKTKLITDSKMMQPRAAGTSQKTPAQILHERATMAEDEKKIAQAGGVVANGGAPLKATGPSDAPKEGEIVPGLARAAVATDNALSSLLKLKEKLSKEGVAGRALSSAKNLGGDSDYMAEVDHAANAIASYEANGMAADPTRVQGLIHNMGSNNTAHAMTHIDALIEQARIKRKTIQDISAKTAKVGTISAPAEGGGEQ